MNNLGEKTTVRRERNLQLRLISWDSVLSCFYFNCCLTLFTLMGGGWGGGGGGAGEREGG